MSAGWKREKRLKRPGGRARGKRLCGIREGHCSCALPLGHKGIRHRCGGRYCNASWHYEAGEFVADTWPVSPSVLLQMGDMHARGGMF